MARGTSFSGKASRRRAAGRFSRHGRGSSCGTEATALRTSLTCSDRGARVSNNMRKPRSCEGSGIEPPRRQDAKTRRRKKGRRGSHLPIFPCAPTPWRLGALAVYFCLLRAALPIWLCDLERAGCQGARFPFSPRQSLAPTPASTIARFTRLLPCPAGRAPPRR